MRKYNPLDLIRIRTNAKPNVLLPEDFSNSTVARALFTPEARHLYSLLRVVGFSACESFGAAFSKELILHPDALVKASAAYDESSHAKRDLLEALTAVSPQVRDAELDRNVASFARAAEDAAMSMPLRVALSDYQPTQGEQRKASDFVRLKSLCKSHADAIALEASPDNGSEVDWSKLDDVTKFHAGGQSISSGRHGGNSLMHGRSDDAGEPVAFDPNAQSGVYKR